MKGELKSKTVDRYLRPIRKQIVDLVIYDAHVIEFGCGSGDQLCMLSSKIKHGLGIDQSKTLINYALKQKEIRDCSNIDFLTEEIVLGYKNSKIYDFSIASLFLHVLPVPQAVDVLNIMLKISHNVIICEFCAPQTIIQKALLWVDQRFTGHYKHFKNYQQNGYMEGLMEQLKYAEIEVYDTFDPVIKLYKITQH